MNYKEFLITANDNLASDKLVRFVGYGLGRGRASGTLKDIQADQIIETPVAENLMMGVAIGLSIKGLRPVVFFERMDFILNALDAIVNHLDKINTISRGEFSPAVIIRAMVGNRTKPLFTGPPHTQDFTEALKRMVSFPVISLTENANIRGAYDSAARNQAKGISTILVEYKDLM